MKRRMLLVVATIFLAITPVAVADHWFGIKWHGHAPLTLKVKLSGLTEAEKDAALFAMGKWSQSTVLDLVETTSKAKFTVSYGTICPSACLDYDPRNGYFASAAVVLNPTWTSGLSQSVRETVLCHELGHGLGLAHQNDPTSCMYPTTAGTNAPNAHDYAQLEAIYG